MCDLKYEFDFKIFNGFFPRKYTCIQPTKGLQSLTDYIVVKENRAIKLCNIRVQRWLLYGSDHSFMKGITYFTYKLYRQGKQEGQHYDNYEGQQWPKCNNESLRQDSTEFLHKLRLAGKLKIKPTGNFQRKYTTHRKSSMKQQM